MDGKPYKCPECSEAFALMTEFKGHMTSQHADTKDLRCSDCYKLFSTPFELEQHRSLEHRLECEVGLCGGWVWVGVGVVCDVCGCGCVGGCVYCRLLELMVQKLYYWSMTVCPGLWCTNTWILCTR